MVCTIKDTLPFFAPPKIDAHLRFDRRVGLTSFAIGRSGYIGYVVYSNPINMIWIYDMLFLLSVIESLLNIFFCHNSVTFFRSIILELNCKPNLNQDLKKRNVNKS